MIKNKKKFIKSTRAQAVVESVIVIPMILVLIMVILQFSIIITVHLAANYAAYKAARAVYISSNRQNRYGYGNNNSAFQDAKTAANDVLTVFKYVLRWIEPIIDVKLYKYDGSRTHGVSPATIDNNTRLDPDIDIWVRVTVKAKILIPGMRRIFGDGAPYASALTWRTINTSTLVHTPHKGSR